MSGIPEQPLWWTLCVVCNKAKAGRLDSVCNCIPGSIPLSKEQRLLNLAQSHGENFVAENEGRTIVYVTVNGTKPIQHLASINQYLGPYLDA